MVRQTVFQRFQNLLGGFLEADNINLFIKEEPHKLLKLEEGRLRLISGVSLIDSIVDKMIFDDIFSVALSVPGETPSMVGWTPLYGGNRFLSGKFPNGVVSVDKSAWDWSVPEWMIDLWLEFVLDMYEGYPEWYLDLVKLRFRLLFEEAVFESSGRVERQGMKGIMKSGCYLTIMLNTLGQLLLHNVINLTLGWEVCKGQPWAYGDDTVQDASFDVEEYARVMRDLGFSPKIQDASRHIEFIGFLMDNEKVIPAYWKKHLFMLKYLKEEVAVETLESYQMLYYAEPRMLNLIHAELRQRCPAKIKSARTLRWLLDLGRPMPQT